MVWRSIPSSNWQSTCWSASLGSVPRNQGTDDQRNNPGKHKGAAAGRDKRPRKQQSLHTSAHFCQGRLLPGRVQADHYLVRNFLVPPSGAAPASGSCSLTPALSHHRGPAQAISDQELGPQDQFWSAPRLPPVCTPAGGNGRTKDLTLSPWVLTDHRQLARQVGWT